MPRMNSVGLRFGTGWEPHVPAEWSRHWTARAVSIGDGTTDVIDVGEGPTLLLVPPLPGYKEAFLACTPHLAKHFRVVTFDLRAHLPREDPWAGLVQDLEHLVKALGLTEFAMVGHSLGGALAQHYLLANPGRVRAVALSSSFRHVSSPRGHWYMRYVEQPIVIAGQRFMPRGAAMAAARRFARDRAWVYDRGCDDAVLEVVRLGIRRCPIGLGLDRVRLAYAHDTRDRITQLECPAMLMVGETDTEFARAEAVAMGRAMQLDVHESPGAGHLHPLSNARWFAETITTWMGSLLRA